MDVETHGRVRVTRSRGGEEAAELRQVRPSTAKTDDPSISGVDGESKTESLLPWSNG
jgi:hypothetical protein